MLLCTACCSQEPTGLRHVSNLGMEMFLKGLEMGTTREEAKDRAKVWAPQHFRLG